MNVFTEIDELFQRKFVEEPTYMIDSNHSRTVNALTISNNRKTLVSSSIDSLNIWDLNCIDFPNVTLVKSIDHKQMFIYKLEFSSNDQYLVAFSSKNNIVVYSCDDFSLELIINCNELMDFILTENDCIIAIQKNGTLHKYCITSGENLLCCDSFCNNGLIKICSLCKPKAEYFLALTTSNALLFLSVDDFSVCNTVNLDITSLSTLLSCQDPNFDTFKSFSHTDINSFFVFDDTVVLSLSFVVLAYNLKEHILKNIFFVCNGETIKKAISFQTTRNKTKELILFTTINLSSTDLFSTSTTLHRIKIISLENGEVKQFFDISSDEEFLAWENIENKLQLCVCRTNLYRKFDPKNIFDRGLQSGGYLSVFETNSLVFEEIYSKLVSISRRPTIQNNFETYPIAYLFDNEFFGIFEFRQLISKGICVKKFEFEKIIQHCWDLLDVNKQNGGNMFLFLNDEDDDDDDDD
eukprot:TRINITY_DN3773_c0_g1_i1.p1 TRINITY_DN3773_c0_g1~~TRINITY_DN3773_c0_g1_i1.p1  ORF type:complete len:466 (-),score=96.03 TRINITY_DN3773_c0_g1_i1:93-1490(-)